MAKTKGQIGVTTENIFPVIKKFLYSDHEIFLRELVANAVDATQKLKAVAGKGDFKGEIGDDTIRIEANGRGGWTPLRPLRGLQETRVAIRLRSGSKHSIGFISSFIDQIIN